VKIHDAVEFLRRLGGTIHRTDYEDRVIGLDPEQPHLIGRALVYRMSYERVSVWPYTPTVGDLIAADWHHVKERAL
jgi:hypothetical protein